MLLTLSPQAAINLITGKLWWVAGGVPTVHDKKIFENCGLKDKLEPGEIGVADKGYQGAEGLLTPLKKKKKASLTEEQKKVNALISTARITVERTIGRIKNWGCLKRKWRGSMEDHWKYFMVVANLVNLSFDIRPLSRTIHPIFQVEEVAQLGKEERAAIGGISVIVDQADSLYQGEQLSS